MQAAVLRPCKGARDEPAFQLIHGCVPAESLRNLWRE